jgi:hypothetical protein
MLLPPTVRSKSIAKPNPPETMQIDQNQECRPKPRVVVAMSLVEHRHPKKRRWPAHEYLTHVYRRSKGDGRGGETRTQNKSITAHPRKLRETDAYLPQPIPWRDDQNPSFLWSRAHQMEHARHDRSIEEVRKVKVLSPALRPRRTLYTPSSRRCASVHKKQRQSRPILKNAKKRLRRS